MSQNIQINHQNFPSDVLKWMKANATPPQALQLMKICKYFQHKIFPYFVLTDLKMTETEMSYSVFTSEEREQEKWHEIDDEEALNMLPNNLWIISELDIRQGKVAFSVISSKLSYCEVSWLTLANQNISFNEFKMLTEAETVEFCNISDTRLYFDNEEDNSISLEDLLQCLPNIQQITISGIIPQIFSLNQLNKIIPSGSWSFVIYKADETFNIHLFADFMKANQKINYFLHFHPRLPSHYIQQLQHEIDNIKKKWSSEYRLPRFVF